MEEIGGKVAVITGGASGIGRALAEELGSAGARLVLGDVEADALAATVAALSADGIEVVGVPTDVRDPAQVDALRDRAVEAFGTAHIVCNNAGVGSGGGMDTLTLADWEWVLGVNLWGVIHGIRSFLPLLKAQDEGHIVNTSSVAGLFAAPFMGPYNASKSAVVAISESLFNELAISGSSVGVSVLCPAWVATAIADSERNRPPELANDGDPQAAAAASGVAELLKGVIAAGMDPAEVARQVREAIATKRFYILTHESSRAAVRARMEAILEDGNPPLVGP